MIAFEEQIAAVPHWRHRISLPGGTVTPGSQDTLSQLHTIGLPQDLTGKSVLDIGCSDGFYSFECEERGASRVLAIDNFSSVYVDAPTGFSVAHRLRDSKVEFEQVDLFELNPRQIGQFDLVLFLGVLYHLRHPLLAIEKLAEFCRGQLIVETEIASQPSRLREKLASLFVKNPRSSWMEFHETDGINRDPTTWWAPSMTCLEGMLRASGFCGVRTHFSSLNRGVCHAFHPSLSAGGEMLLRRFGVKFVLEACNYLYDDTENGSPPVAEFLNQLSISEFAVIQDRLNERTAKHWHQVERWNSTNVG